MRCPKDRDIRFNIIVDKPTAKSYDSDAHGFCERYEAADVAELHEFLSRHVHEGMRVLEIGCGSGRDAAFMDSELGSEVTALDGSAAMVELARTAHPEIADRIHHTVMPLSDDENAEFAESFDVVVCLAMLMHLPDDELAALATQVRQWLKPDGVLLLSASTGRPGLTRNRDTSGRLFIDRPPDILQSILANAGFRLLEHESVSDALHRDFIWHQMAFGVRQ